MVFQKKKNCNIRVFYHHFVGRAHVGGLRNRRKDVAGSRNEVCMAIRVILLDSNLHICFANKVGVLVVIVMAQGRHSTTSPTLKSACGLLYSFSLSPN